MPLDHQINIQKVYRVDFYHALKLAPSLNGLPNHLCFIYTMKPLWSKLQNRNLQLHDCGNIFTNADPPAIVTR